MNNKAKANGNLQKSNIKYNNNIDNEKKKEAQKNAKCIL